MPKPNRSATAISSTPAAEDEVSIGSNTAQNHGKPVETVFAGEKQLLGLRAWLELDPSKSTSWQIVRALVDESLKKVSLSGDLRRFTDEELHVAAELEEFDWRGVRTWWQKRRDEARSFLAERDRDGALIDLERFPGGGRGIKASTGIVIRTCESTPVETSDNDDETSSTGGPVRYRSSSSGLIQLSGPWRRRLFAAGEIEVGSTRHAILRWRLMTSALLLLVIGLVFLFDLFVRNRPIETQNLAYLLGLLIIGKLWWQEWRPIYYARVDRITALPEEWLKDDELPAQLERKRTGSGEVIRLVRYQAVCPICGADIHLGEGAPSDPRRVLGRCIDAPREHVFTFDPVSHCGRPLRDDYSDIS